MDKTLSHQINEVLQSNNSRNFEIIATRYLNQIFKEIEPIVYENLNTYLQTNLASGNLPKQQVQIFKALQILIKDNS